MFDHRTYLSLNTTAAGLTAARASALKEAGLFAFGVSLDSMNPEEHDRMRGKDGAFDTAITGLALAHDAGLYPYVVTVANGQLLERDTFHEFLAFCGAHHAREIHLLEPCPTGKLAGQTQVKLTQEHKARILGYQEEISDREDLPALSSFLYLEGSDAFGCGAGLTHLYIDGTGEVSPCNLVPLSFGNVANESFDDILERMGRHFQEPRCDCAGQVLSPHIRSGTMPLSPSASDELCRAHLPANHEIPRFFQVRAKARAPLGGEELSAAYDSIHDYYDDYWVTSAGAPVEELISRISFEDVSTAFEAGCGTGFATALLSSRLPDNADLIAADISRNMLGNATARLGAQGSDNVRFRHGDAVAELGRIRGLDLIVSTWVLGYIPLAEFFAAAAGALKQGGQLAFIVHRDNSPTEPLELFHELVGENPACLMQAVDFDFPKNSGQVRRMLTDASMEVEMLSEGVITFDCATAQDALDHLLRSGAGTAFFDAIKPSMRDDLTERFLQRLAAKGEVRGNCDVTHDYVTCLARRI